MLRYLISVTLQRPQKGDARQNRGDVSDAFRACPFSRRLRVHSLPSLGTRHWPVEGKRFRGTKPYCSLSRSLSSFHTPLFCSEKKTLSLR